MKNKKLLALVEKAANNDPAAFHALCELKNREIIFLCGGQLNDWGLAEDAAQEVLLLMHKNIGRLRSPEAFTVWMNKIIFTACRDVRRKNMGYQLAASDEALQSLPSDETGSSPLEYVQEQEKCEMVWTCIQSLPENHRNCILLHYYQKLSYAEIAHVLDISVNAVNNNLRMGRKNLQPKIEELVDTEKMAGFAPALAVGPLIHSALHQCSIEMVSPKLLQSCMDGAAARTSSAWTSVGQKKSSTRFRAISVASIVVVGLLLSMLYTSVELKSEKALTQRPAMLAGIANEGVIHGQLLLYSDGADKDRGLAGVRLSLHMANDGACEVYSTTDESGSFSFYGLPAGEYLLSIELPPDTRQLAGAETPLALQIPHEEGQSISINSDTVETELFVYLHAPVILVGKLEADAFPDEFPGEINLGINIELVDSDGLVIAAAVLEKDATFVFAPVLLADAGQYHIRAMSHTGQPVSYISETELYLYPGYGFTT